MKYQKKSVSIISIFFISLMLSIACFAQAKKEQKKQKKWPSGNVHFGFYSNTGNSRDENITGELNLKHGVNKWEFLGHTDGQFTTTAKGKTVQNLTVKGESAYYYRPKYFGFGNANYKYDHFSPFTTVIYAVAGLGWRALNSDKYLLILQAGPGYRRQETDSTNKIERGPIFYAAGDFKWQFTKYAAFKQRISVDSGSKNTYTESKSAISTTIVGNLGMECSFTLKHNTTIPTGSSNKYKTDTLTKVEIVYKWD